jgi:predicted ATPase/DNA-binding SARP family transcriptional activator
VQKARKRCYGRVTDGQGLEFRILGPLEVVAGGLPVTVGGTKARGLLAFLLLHRGQAVNRERLVDELWGERPPRAVAAELRVYVAKLRKALRPELIVTRGDGYVLLAGDEEVDAVRFERSARQGSESLAAGDAEVAAGVLADALALWRGPVLADLAYEPWVQGEARRLEELRLAALEDRLEADLACGRHARVVSELERLVVEQPYRERLRAQLMLALYRSGRQSAALELYRQTAALFAAELGIEPGPELRSRERAILNHDPALRLRELAAGNLPAPPNPLVGRRQELEELTALLARPEARLVTLTGTGGSGKTRLALELAARLERALAVPAFFVELAPLADAGLVLTAIARTLGVEDVGAAPLIETLPILLRHRRLLLVLDNLEHVLDAGPDIAALLADVPGLIVLATSRSQLQLRGERRYEVGPLLIDDAVALFVERARAARSKFEPDSAVEVLCRRLDQLPLALELAAARVNALTPPEIVERLSGRFDLLTTGARDAPERQRTLRATVDWSYELLDEEEQRLFRRLAVFAGGYTFDAAEAVCDAKLYTIESLIDKNLVRREDDRFTMLETIREYARERLNGAELGDHFDQLRRRHANYFCGFIEQDAPGEIPDTRRWLDAVDDELDNLRAAFDTYLETGGIELGSRIFGSLWRFWVVRGYLSEGRRWIEQLLAASSEARPSVQLKMLKMAAALANEQNDDEAMSDLTSRRLALARAEENQAEVAVCLNDLGLVAYREGDFARAASLFRESIALSRELGEPAETAVGNLARTVLQQGDPAQAEALVLESLALARDQGFLQLVVDMTEEIGWIRINQGRLDQAVEKGCEAFELADQLGYKDGLRSCCEFFGIVLSRQGNLNRAAQLLAKAELLREELGIRAPGRWRLLADAEARIRRQLDQKAVDAATNSGRDAAVRELLETALREAGVATMTGDAALPREHR